MALIMAAPPVVMEPEVVEDYGAPDIFATGWTMNFGPEVITGISHIDRAERGVLRRYVVCRVHYPRSQWMDALNTTLIGVKGGAGH